MQLSLKLSIPALAVFLLVPLLVTVGGCSCGFDCHNDSSDNVNPAVLTLGLSDSLPEDLKQVVLEVDTITFKRSGSSDVIVDTFTLPGQTEAATFKIDLLQYPGLQSLTVIDGLEMPTGSYDSVEIKIVTGGTEHSYVQLQDDTLQELTANNSVLQIPGIQLVSGDQQFVIEFGLAQSLQLQSSSGNYLMSNTGIRIENTATDATLSGQVDSSLFNTVVPCNAKTNPLVGNRVYLYQGRALTTTLGDVFSTINASAQAPYAVASMMQNANTQQWEYAFGYVPAGNYTLAFACNTANDNSVTYDGLTIPLPTNQKYNISLSTSQRAVCNLASGANC
jgi:hypothetical protein